MIAPPGTAHVAEPLPGYQAGGRTAPTSKRDAFRILRAELGVTGAQAHALYVAYERDVADAMRIGNDTGRSDLTFIDWLMRQAPSQRPRSRRRWRVGEGGGWAVTS
ncbi:hypothetical protein [Nocardioides panaciterrulae]|uniref:Uncharacterized protein n=1 Tax=Nocardioides panaciterrulae TaxID=661492 RepID=A0A7Y9EAN1_9ACTN|nr:hypothetical protein [Nocardioides panaciterrulae]NYD39949.1 hypothetical protein [Nocardioides panaciterrulae]NYD43981.1 hypothetical protein [Nocardioides panaciterrulae]